MKILFNTHIHAFQNPGGGEIVLLKTKEALQKRGVHVDLLDKWTVKFHEYDIIHDFALLGWRDWNGLKSYGPKLVVTPTAWPAVNFPIPQVESLKFGLREILGATSPETSICHAMKIPDMFCPTTLMEQGRIQKRYGIRDSHRFRVIPNGITEPQILDGTNTFQEKYKLNEYLLFIGRLSPNKNVLSIIKAAGIAGKKIVIIGGIDKGDEEYNKELRKHTSENVLFVDPLPHDSKIFQDAYRGAKALIVASFFETCSLVGMEAGAYGTPVIMTERGATKEVYQDFVTYVNPADLNSLVYGIQNIWEQNKNLKLQKHILDNYTWDKIVEKLINVYSEVLKN